MDPAHATRTDLDVDGSKIKLLRGVDIQIMSIYKTGLAKACALHT